MATLRRNDPCPCGSGRKFKKCCLGTQAGDAFLSKEAEETQEEPLNPFFFRQTRPGSGKTVWDLSEKEIIERLSRLGKGVDRPTVAALSKHARSPGDLVCDLTEKLSIAATGVENAFVWRAAIALWERRSPYATTAKRIMDLMRKGYELRERKRDCREACRLWLEAWKSLKPRIPPFMKSFDDLDSLCAGDIEIAWWSQELESELGNAGTEDAAFYDERIRYCQEFCALFPASNKMTLHNMKRAVAETYFSLGRVSEGERAFGALAEEFPDNPWTYIGWGDMYCLSPSSKTVPLDYDRAEQLYRTALKRTNEEASTVHERLNNLLRARAKESQDKGG